MDYAGLVLVPQQRPEVHLHPGASVMSKLTFKPMQDMTSVAQGKQSVFRDGQRVGFVLKREGKWFGYVTGHPERLMEGKSREKAFLAAESAMLGDETQDDDA